MKPWGIGLIVLGAIAALVALTIMPSTVSTEEMTTLPYTGSVIGSGRYTETYNLPRAQLRELVFHGGGILFLSGVLLLVGGMLDERLSALFRPAGAAAAVTPALASEGVTAEPATGGDELASAAAPIQAVDKAEEVDSTLEIVGWVFGGFCLLMMLIAGLALAYGPK